MVLTRQEYKNSPLLLQKSFRKEKKSKKQNMLENVQGINKKKKISAKLL